MYLSVNFIRSKINRKVNLMWKTRKSLVLQQLDETLTRFAELKSIRPPKGWIRAVREALGMSGRQFAARLGVTPPRVTVLEREEISGGISLKTLRQAAEALDCEVVYALVPRSSLQQAVRRQAEKVAAVQLSQVGHSMVLEAQELPVEEQRRALQSRVDALADELPKNLWDGLP
jgi:predicted DNA-binding mobile mystery protein A